MGRLALILMYENQKRKKYYIALKFGEMSKLGKIILGTVLVLFVAAYFYGTHLQNKYKPGSKAYNDVKNHRHYTQEELENIVANYIKSDLEDTTQYENTFTQKVDSSGKDGCDYLVKHVYRLKGKPTKTTFCVNSQGEVERVQ